MSKTNETVQRVPQNEEREAKARSGMPMLLLNLLLSLVAVAVIVMSAIAENSYGLSPLLFGVALFIGIAYLCVGMPILLAGLKVLRPNEAYVFTLFGKYYGTLKGDGFYFINPFAVGVNPARPSGAYMGTQTSGSGVTQNVRVVSVGGFRKISLKAMTLSNEKQKINDLLGNPIEIGIVVIWRVINTAQAVFNVDNYQEFLSIQCDSALRNIVRKYPYDVAEGGDESSLRGSSQEVAEKLKMAIQDKVTMAGLEIVEARITHLAYAPEIAAAMLQRQQASAIIDARKMIVDGAVGMVEMALEKLNENGIVQLDEERKAAMVSNLLVVLCGNKDAQPIVNSGSLY